MKIFAYRVVQKGPRALATVIDRLHNLPIQDRFFGSGSIRLEQKAMRDGFLLMDFAKARGGHGPGRMSRTQALQDISLRDVEEFGEDTGMAFDPRTNYVVIQYNHYGPRERSVEDYLYAFDLSLGGLRPAQNDELDEDRCGFEFGVLLKSDAYALTCSP